MTANRISRRYRAALIFEAPDHPKGMPHAFRSHAVYGCSAWPTLHAQQENEGRRLTCISVHDSATRRTMLVRADSHAVAIRTAAVAFGLATDGEWKRK